MTQDEFKRIMAHKDLSLAGALSHRSTFEEFIKPLGARLQFKMRLFEDNGIQEARIFDVGVGHVLVVVDRAQHGACKAARSRLLWHVPVGTQVTVVDAALLKAVAANPNIPMAEIVDAAWAHPDLMRVNPIVLILGLENVALAERVHEALNSPRIAWD